MSLKDIFNVKGKTVLITGANGYLGRYMAGGLASVGCNLILTSKSTNVHGLTAGFRNLYPDQKFYSYSLDFNDFDLTERVLSTIASKVAPDALVCNAYDISSRTGFNTPDGRLDALTHTQWASSFDCGTYWTFQTIQPFLKGMRERKRGSIVNIASMYGTVAPDPALYDKTDAFNPVTYGVQKAGILALTRYIASFCGDHNIRCNAISPGAFPNTERVSENYVKPDDRLLSKLLKKTALNRVGVPQDLVGALIYLVSDASSYMTGQNLIIDGGWTIR